MRTGIWASILLAGGLLAMSAAGAEIDGTPSPVPAKCQSCHGLDGNSAAGEIPRLNGQPAEYLELRLHDLMDPGREDPHATAVMWGVVQQVDDETLARIAQYYARQKPPLASQAHGALASEGRKLYVDGDPANYIPGCGSCHGADAEGHGGAPRLAGQHAEYLRNQLERMRLDLRASGVMHPKINNMTDKQIDALLAYLAG